MTKDLPDADKAAPGYSTPRVLTLMHLNRGEGGPATPGERVMHELWLRAGEQNYEFVFQGETKELRDLFEGDGVHLMMGTVAYSLRCDFLELIGLQAKHSKIGGPAFEAFTTELLDKLIEAGACGEKFGVRVVSESPEGVWAEATGFARRLQAVSDDPKTPQPYQGLLKSHAVDEGEPAIRYEFDASKLLKLAVAQEFEQLASAPDEELIDVVVSRMLEDKHSPMYSPEASSTPAASTLH